MSEGGIFLAFTPWYKEMSVYQIWTRSFCDGNGDGIGDLWGVLSKLDYIKRLGVDAIWFSPIYPSPNGDWGYDISDYMDIHPDFGNLDVFRQVLDEAHKRGLKVFMDLVVNHTSKEHPWFKASRDPDSPYHNYYHWRKGRLGGLGKNKRLPPNNWTSMFQGDAWEYDSLIDKYYLYLFSKSQPDLNMENPEVRNEVKKILRFWLDMGVDGFREDVITYIAKAPGMPDSFPKLPIANGMQYFANQPAVYDYLKEFRDDVLSKYDCFVIGEAPLTSPETALKYTTEGENKVLDEMIGFSHMEADCFMVDAIQLPFNLRKMKKAFSDWQYKLAGKAWNALYIENHDHPRIINRYGSEKYRVESGKMLAAMYILLRGTPFIYQGQEIGMTNLSLPRLDMYKDVQTFNHARIISKLTTKKKAFALVQAANRENSRTPMQWSSAPNAGFSSARPWFYVNDNYKDVNVEDEEKDPDSILNFYKMLLALRKNDPLILYGDYHEYFPKNKDFYVYERTYSSRSMLVICCFSANQPRFDAPANIDLNKWRLRISNYDQNFLIANGFTARPYELRVYFLE